MSKKPAIQQFVLFLSVLLFAFKTPEKFNFKPEFRPASPLQLIIQSDTGGRTVNLDSAQACINRYTNLMEAHGFSNPGGQPVNIHIRKTSPLTTGESFNGKNLQDWLNATAEQYVQAGKTLMIKIQFGVYDMNYLNTYQPDANARTANNNRIAIFLIPYDAASGQSFRVLNAQPSGGSGSGGTGYDLGGLQP